MDKYSEQLKISHLKEQKAATSSLGALITLGNKEAFHELFKFLKHLPPPKTIEDVHFKKGILRYFELKYSELSEFRN